MIIHREIKGFIFDLDGVITDTAELHYRSWKKLADEEGIPFTREDNEQLRGVSRRKSLELLLNGREVPEEKKLEMMDRKNNYYKEFIKQITEEDLLPGAKELLDELKSRGYKLAVASASKNAKPVIKNLGVEHVFDQISDGYSVEKTKPAPDLFLYTAKQLGLKPEECVVIEDAEAGIEAALAAGMTAVGIGPEERVGKAHFRYDKVADINLDDILA
ncbi:beta-phosphoglucomutase [Halothermothrix orenii]|uniref:Beta-phosphoglucomutase n=1 Tax=Halothermothrix orenii (strain H 168 / OCM 544 / DSM 9562) TaxID=373903 RepID=B8D050_HALOH|nr:beta-phosphoglucomutase [Halothermothrix orenii]ACL68804.1 beta-phosphoglucomutase [Halothermothrix orenii H 168]